MTADRILEKRIGEKLHEAPQVSVVIPAYNVAEFIAETLDSVLSQTFKSFETILVNDGSPDTEKLEKVLEPYFENIIYIKQKNGGTAAARNTAIHAARGEFIAFLDGDDVWLPDYLAEQTRAIIKRDCDLIYADAQLFGSGIAAAAAAGNGKSKTFMQKSPSRGAVKTESLIEGSCNLITSGTLVRRARVLETGLFDEDLPKIGMEDFDLWMRLTKSGARLDYQRKVLLKYRVRTGSLSGSNVQRAERSIVALDTIERKHQFSESEKNALARRRELANAELELERGKFNLTQEKFDEARKHFRLANRYYRKIKLRAVMWLLAVYPKLVLTLFKKMRSADFSFIVPNASSAETIIAEPVDDLRN